MEEVEDVVSTHLGGIEYLVFHGLVLQEERHVTEKCKELVFWSCLVSLDAAGDRNVCLFKLVHAFVLLGHVLRQES